MTMRDKIEKALAELRRNLSDFQIEAKKIADDVARQVHDDICSRPAGLATTHGAIKLTEIGTRINECHNQITMLEWILREDDLDVV